MKLILDLTISITLLVLLLPLFLIIAILIKLDSSGPVFFRQWRVGRNEVKFRIYKFRTMQTVQKTDALKITIGADPRITGIGHFLRRYKIDELPQLLNVLIGDMSLVGPRPEVAEYVNYYSATDKKTIFSLRPGITDLASIRFKNESEILGQETDPTAAYIHKIMPRKLRYCRFYARKKTLWLDVKIIFMTVRAII